MNLKKHSHLEGRHAYLSASNYHWINYDEEKLTRVFHQTQRAIYGTQLHELAHSLIKLGEKLPRTTRTLNMYVNDCIGFRMTPEQKLFYSENCFGTADAVGFKNNMLRISDLKTGENTASLSQLEVYAALFCLEYRFKPTEIKIELRIYQNDEILIAEGDVLEITRIMDRIVTFDRLLNALREEV